MCPSPDLKAHLGPPQIPREEKSCSLATTMQCHGNPGPPHKSHLASHHCESNSDTEIRGVPKGPPAFPLHTSALVLPLVRPPLTPFSVLSIIPDLLSESQLPELQATAVMADSSFSQTASGWRAEPDCTCRVAKAYMKCTLLELCWAKVVPALPRWRRER